jgi:hypothetical protein
MKTEGTQLVAAFAVFPLPILFFCARCFTRIYDLRTGAMQEIRGAQRLQQWRRRQQKQWTGKQWISPTLPLHSFLVKEHGLRRGVRSGNASPLMGREITKLPCCPRNGQRLVNVTYREILLLTSWVVARWKTTRQIWILDKYWIWCFANKGYAKGICYESIPEIIRL